MVPSGQKGNNGGLQAQITLSSGVNLPVTVVSSQADDNSGCPGPTQSYPTLSRHNNMSPHPEDGGVDTHRILNNQLHKDATEAVSHSQFFEQYHP